MFRDRADAGRRLAELLLPLRAEQPLVLGLPRGGVVVAAEVAKALGATLDLVVVRKLGVPGHEELGMGAIAEGAVEALNRRVMTYAEVTPQPLDRVRRREAKELARRVTVYRTDRPPPDVAGRTVILVDDGLATGYTARAAARAMRRAGAGRIVLAVPVASPDTLRALEEEVDDTVAVVSPYDLHSVGAWYEDFRQTTDQEVLDLLTRGRLAAEEVVITAGPVSLPGRQAVPAAAAGLVVFAHGSGSSRHSPRNLAVAASLERTGFATLLFDLLTPAEAADRANVFDIPLLASRLADAARWAAHQPDLAGLPLGLFGASTGAGAALWAAADPQLAAVAVVSRGGRPDLAGDRLRQVTAPTLLIVGERDPQVMDLNRQAQAQLAGPSELHIVPGAGHLFEEAGALEVVAAEACRWFDHHLRPRARKPD